MTFDIHQVIADPIIRVISFVVILIIVTHPFMGIDFRLREAVNLIFFSPGDVICCVVRSTNSISILSMIIKLFVGLSCEIFREIVVLVPVIAQRGDAETFRSFLIGKGRALSQST